METRPEARNLFWPWMTSVTVGEFLGFSAPALAGLLTRNADNSFTLVAMIFGGAIEGAVLGSSQALVLRRIYPGLSVRRWIMLTSAAASFAWLIGMTPSTFHAVWASWPFPVAAVVAALLGCLLLSSIGAAQYVELRRHLAGAGVWVGVTAGAWCAGLVVFSIVAPPLWHEGQSQGVVLAIGLIAGALMAATMAASSGFALVRMLRSPRKLEGVRR